MEWRLTPVNVKPVDDPRIADILLKIAVMEDKIEGMLGRIDALEWSDPHHPEYGDG